MRRRDVLASSAMAWVVSSLGGCASTAAEPERKNPTGDIPRAIVRLDPVVHPLKQEQSNLCWAAVWAMMFSWRNQSQMRVAHAIDVLGPSWRRLYDANEGLPAQDYFHEEFVKASGLRTEPPANHLPPFYVSLLCEHGPLWINTGNGDLNHARLMTGARVATRTGATEFELIDPAVGAVGMISDGQLFHEFEEEARVIVNNDLKWELRFQILHW
jgi:hypothetical protein